jgi:hypothetical protein
MKERFVGVCEKDSQFLSLSQTPIINLSIKWKKNARNYIQIFKLKNKLNILGPF